MPFEGIRVEGLSGLMRACAASEQELRLGVRAKLREAAEPVRVAAEHLAPVEIRNLLSPTAERDWWKMKTGVTPSLVYVAPGIRRLPGGHRRPNLAPLLQKAMNDALAANAPEVEAALGRALDDIAQRNW